MTVAQSLTPTSGVLHGRVHVLPVRVYYEDTDAGGVVYYANYLKFAERGRTELLRTLGIEQQKPRDETGVIFMMYEGDVKYRRPARLDDALTVETAVVQLGAASVKMRQVIRHSGSHEEMAIFNAHVACTGPDGKPARIPDSVREALGSFVSDA